MVVGFFVDPIFYKVGTGDFLNSFFSTIYVRLENSEWGNKYPFIMNKLYKGCVEKDNIVGLKKELNKIRKDFKKLPPDQIVWDHENLNSSPPWGNKISSDITDMSNYFITSDGKNLLEVLEEAINASIEIDEDLCIKSV